MVTRFFTVKPEQVSDYKLALIPDNDILPLEILGNSRIVYQDEKKAICMVLLSSSILNDLAVLAEVKDPLTIEAVIALNIGGSYVGTEYTDIWAKFPELKGPREIGVDEDGSPIMVDIVERHTWL